VKAQGGDHVLGLGLSVELCGCAAHRGVLWVNGREAEDGSTDRIVRRYFGAFNTSRQDRWVFSDRDSGAYLLRFCWTNIVRHQIVPGTASHDDPTLTDYWAERRRRGNPRTMDPTSLRLLRAQHGRVRVGTGPSAIAAAGAVWVANTLDGTVSRIDPGREVVTATVQVGDGPSALAVSPGAVWVTNEFAGTVTRIDPRTPVVAQTISVGNDPTSIAVAGGAVWVGVHAATAAHRGGTLRILAAIPRLDSIDPGIAFMLFPPQLLGMTNDGLVTLKHVGGSDGTQLVPDLAVSLPAPADNGRSYRFQLRPGIRYSIGEPVRPEDFRRAIERDFRIGSPGGPFFADIIGADRCRGARTAVRPLGGDRCR
jgi:YVTN family beta-propeller protein